jgi:uncharacterized protein YidB (DUF937 family)
MSILDGVLGGLVSAGVTAAVNHVVQQHGGVQGLVKQFEQNGLGSIVQSWVGTGTNQAIATTQIQQALGSDTVKQLAAKVGMTPEDLSAKLAEFLPGAVDKLTPNGTIPQAA